jgi:hypothetical protein
MEAEEVSENYVTVGSAVWVPDKVDKSLWHRGVVKAKEGKLFTVSFGQGRSEEVVERKNVLAANPDELFKDGFPDDIIKLSNLNEPSIHELVAQRFADDKKPEGIYTNAGPVLIAINPCRALPIYSNEVQQHYIQAYQNVYKGGYWPPSQRRLLLVVMMVYNGHVRSHDGLTWRCCHDMALLRVETVNLCKYTCTAEASLAFLS